MTHIDKPCPSCGSTTWYIDYMQTADGDMRVDHCDECDWPPSSPMSPEEWRAHPNNPLNRLRSDR